MAREIAPNCILLDEHDDSEAFDELILEIEAVLNDPNVNVFQF